MPVETMNYKVSGLMCSFCTMSVESALKRRPGVRGVMVNLVHGVVLVEADSAVITREEVGRAIASLGYDVSASESQHLATDEALFQLIRRRGAVGMVLALVDLVVDPLDLFGLPAQPRAAFSLIVSGVILLWVGQPILRKTLLAIRQRVINANVLLSAGAWGAFAIGTAALFDARWPNFLPVAGWLMALHLFFGFFKLDTRRKASEAVRKLLDLQPARARVLRGDAAVEVRTSDVVVGETLVVRPGERIPLDGEIVEGTASVDESSFTGESVPAMREVGASVIGGTLNLDGALQVRVTTVGSDTFLSQIVRLMSQIAERKPPLELLADRLMNVYGPVVFVVALVAFVGWWLATGDPVRATVVLVSTVIMGYPCALGITTPMLAAIAGGRGMSIGLLVKASEVFHELAEVDTVVLDKTGTLTYGRPTVTDVVGFGTDRSQVLALVAAVEAQSEHPVGRAIGFFAEREGAARHQVERFRAWPGKGVSGEVAGRPVLAGKPSFVAEHGAQLGTDAEVSLQRLAADAKTVVLVARDGLVVGLVALQDAPRADAARLIERLRDRGVRVVMCTGDARPVAEAIARQLGIETVLAELLPTGKVEAIRELQQSGRKVAMVGDGINDAPALAQADVGIAIGAGTDVAIESAGVILVGGRLEDVAGALVLGKAAYRTTTLNVVVAVLFNVAGMALAAMGLVRPMTAIVVMILSIFAILLNTLRIRSLDLGRSESAAPSRALAEVQFSVPKMVCEGCAERIGDALGDVAGVKDVRSIVPQKRVVVRYESNVVNADALAKALSDAGYDSVRT